MQSPADATVSTIPEAVAVLGRSNKMIGSELSISEHTVKAHLKTILAKLGASDRTHAVTIAMRRGFLDMQQ